MTIDLIKSIVNVYNVKQEHQLCIVREFWYFNELYDNDVFFYYIGTMSLIVHSYKSIGFERYYKNLHHCTVYVHTNALSNNVVVKLKWGYLRLGKKNNSTPELLSLFVFFIYFSTGRLCHDVAFSVPNTEYCYFTNRLTANIDVPCRIHLRCAFFFFFLLCLFFLLLGIVYNLIIL